MDANKSENSYGCQIRFKLENKKFKLKACDFQNFQ